MRVFTKKITRQICLSVVIGIIFSQIAACSVLAGFNTNRNSNESQQLAEVLFRVAVKDPLPADAKLTLEILDDVTGLYFNSSRFEMGQDDNYNYSIRIPLKISSEIKYRYVREAAGSDYEYDTQQQQVRFRILRVDGPQIVEDIITTWMDKPYTGPVGRITGQAIDKSSNAPIPNLLITAGGMQTISASDGSFLLTGLVPGVHNLVIYSMDGAYETFQQGALIAEGASTPVQVYLNKRATTEVTFEVSLPSGIDETMPLRFISNLNNLGNAYADLSAGSAASSVNYPVLEKTSRGHYSIKLEIPVGFYLRYKYSLGDGFWNSELTSEGKFVVRDLLVYENATIRDSVNTFTASGYEPVKIIAKTPDSTPIQETVFIQFNPFGWMEPIPMVLSSTGQWEFTVYSPLQFLGTVEYRFCRNGQCEIAAENTTEVRNFLPSSTAQTLKSTVITWHGLDDNSIDSSKLLSLESVQPRPDFIAGIELSPVYLPDWRSSIDEGLTFSSGIGSDWVILSPTWTATQKTVPEIEVLPGKDLLWTELMTQVSHVTMSEQTTILFPVINYTQDPDKFWSDESRSETWWLTWYDQYQRFLFHNADLAQIMGVEALIIGDPSIIPSINVQEVAEGVSVAPAEYATERWDSLISGIRDRFSGQLIGVVSVSADYVLIPAWLDKVDMVYVLLSPSLENLDGSVSEIKLQFDSILDETVSPIAQEFDKPVIVGVSYASNEQGGNGYLLSNPYQQLTPDDALGVESAPELQAKIYSAAILSASSHDWISGFISRGYYPFVELQDASSSIYRKPASEILWFWFHYLLNKSP